MIGMIIGYPVIHHSPSIVLCTLTNSEYQMIQMQLPRPASKALHRSIIHLL